MASLPQPLFLARFERSSPQATSSITTSPIVFTIHVGLAGTRSITSKPGGPRSSLLPTAAVPTPKKWHTQNRSASTSLLLIITSHQWNFPRLTPWLIPGGLIARTASAISAVQVSPSSLRRPSFVHTIASRKPRNYSISLQLSALAI